MKRKFKSIIGLLLVFFMILGLVPQQTVNASTWYPDITEEFTVENEDGTYIYKVQVSEDKLSYQLDMTNLDTNEMTTLIYENGIASTYKTILNDKARANSRVLVSTVDYTGALERAKEIKSSRAYGTKTECIVPTLAGNNLWYQIGNGADSGYMLMGCDWYYRTPVNACVDCSTFRNKIIESNSNFAKAGLSDAVALAVCVAILAGGVTGGLSIALAMGLTGSAAYYLLDACVAEDAAHTAYDVAKTYGVRQY